MSIILLDCCDRRRYGRERPARSLWSTPDLQVTNYVHQAASIISKQLRFFLCFALYWIVRILHYLVLSSGRRVGENGEQTTFMKVTQKVLGMNPILSIIYGMLMTITVQSSSIVTSTLTPLVALDIITLEQMLPLTLGANIGTTCTAFIASVVSGSQDAIQVPRHLVLFEVRNQLFRSDPRECSSPI